MRYYKIDVGGKLFESYVAGKNLPGALDVEFDIPVFPFAVPSGAAYVKVWGVSIKDIEQASDLNGKDVSVFGGFQKGLPLANPAQAGLLVKGSIFQAFGNWVGTEQSLDLIIYPKVGTDADPKNFVLDWKKGQKLSEAVKATLSTAFPEYAVELDIDDSLVLPADETHAVGTLTQFAEYVKGVSREIVGGDYQGVDLTIRDGKLIGYDGTGAKDPKEIAFRDMIGQPTWIDPLSVQVKFPMRADLAIGDYVKFPPALVTTAPGTTSPFVNAKSTFQGTFQIGQVRHVGHFRQPTAEAWVTIVNAYSAQAAT